MKIIITGGNGYIGARLSGYFADEGHNVIPVCFPSVPADGSWTAKMGDIIEGDLRDDKLIDTITKMNPDVIIHLVSLDHFDSEKEPGFVNSINVMPTWQLLQAGTKNGLKKFIYFSTVQVYGKIPDVEINEEYPVNTANAYGLTHYLSENICAHYNNNSGTNVISVRLSNSYGAPLFLDNNCWWLAINDLCKGAVLDGEIKLLSDGSPRRDFIHGNDICSAIKCLLETDKKGKNNIYNISSGETYTLMELAKIIKREYLKFYKKDVPVITPAGVIKANTGNNSDKKYTISNEKLKTLGFKPAYTIEQGVNELFTFIEKNKISLR